MQNGAGRLSQGAAGKAGRAIGVLTGVSSSAALVEAGAHVVLDSIADLEAAL